VPGYAATGRRTGRRRITQGKMCAMDAWSLTVVVGLAPAFDLTNGFHDSSSSVGQPVLGQQAGPPGEGSRKTRGLRRILIDVDAAQPECDDPDVRDFS
jgi:hypothetical protein